jgi:CubicO group peptidase (beta-lactamase class C family)
MDRRQFLLGAAALGCGPSASPRPSLEALEQIVRRGSGTHSDAVVVYRHDRKLVESYFGTPIAPIKLMSATKSIVSVVVGTLVGREIAHVDLPLTTWFPTTPHKRITLRHVLTQTTGLGLGGGDGIRAYEADDCVAHALALPVAEEPGTTFRYNNAASNILAGIVRAVTNKPLDVFANEVLFAPLEIAKPTWRTDKAGNAYTMSSLELTALDLAKVGRMLCTGGTWNGHRILSSVWLRDSMSPQVGVVKRYGFMWWIIEDGRYVVDDETLASWQSAGIKRETIEAASPYRGRALAYDAYVEMLDAIDKVQTDFTSRLRAGRSPTCKVLSRSDIYGYGAGGWLGQRLAILPSCGIVGARLRRHPVRDADYDVVDYEYSDFASRLVDFGGLDRSQHALSPAALGDSAF